MKLNYNEVLEFLRFHYKSDRFENENGFNNNREHRITLSVIEELEKYNKSIITHHSSKTNETIIFDKKLEIIKRTKGKNGNLCCIF